MAGSCRAVAASGSGGDGGNGGVSASVGGRELSTGTGSSVDRARLVLAGRGGSSPLSSFPPSPIPQGLTCYHPSCIPAYLLQTPLPAANPPRPRLTWRSRHTPALPWPLEAAVSPHSPSPQSSSSDMSLQSGLRSHRYSRATHSLYRWQANSASVQTLENWGTVGVGGSQRRRREVAGRCHGQHRHGRAGRGLWCPVSGCVVSSRLSKGREQWRTHPQHTWDMWQ